MSFGESSGFDPTWLVFILKKHQPAQIKAALH